MRRLYIQRLGGPAATWKQRLLLAVTGLLALMVTTGLLITGFFIALALLGILILVAAVLWVRHRLFGARRGPARGARGPVVIDAEYVVLPRKPQAADRTTR